MIKRILILHIFPILVGFMIIGGCATTGKMTEPTTGITDEFDWLRWRGPNGDGISIETDWNPEALVGGPKILWNVEVGVGYSNVVIKDNRLYTMGVKGVYCLNAETGEEIWVHSFEGWTDFQSTPTIGGKYVYILSEDGVVSCLQAKNGKIRWKKDLVSDYGAVRPYWGFAGSPVVEGELLILTANTSGMALNRETGQMVWSSEKPPQQVSTIQHPLSMTMRGNAMLLSLAGRVSFQWMCKPGNHSG
jgi:outer membrane protein assembly factor BamB